MNKVALTRKDTYRGQLLLGITFLGLVRLATIHSYQPWDMLYIGSALTILASGILYDSSSSDKRLNVNLVLKLCGIEAILTLIVGMQDQFIFLGLLGSLLTLVWSLCQEFQS